MIELIIAVGVGVFLGGLVALRYIAPKTATTKDDKVLAAAEKVAPFVETLKK